MSDLRVRAAVEQMEAWLKDPAWQPDPEALAQWDAEFHAAVSKADKGEGWPELVERAHEAGRCLEGRSEAVAVELVLMKAKLQVQDQGHRALKGYGASSR